MSARIDDLEDRVSKLERARSPEALKWAGTVRCSNLIVSYAARISNETIINIRGPRKFPHLVTIRAAAAYVMIYHGAISQENAGRALGGRDHSTISNMKDRHFERDEVMALADRILKAYEEGGS